MAILKERIHLDKHDYSSRSKTMKFKKPSRSEIPFMVQHRHVAVLILISVSTLISCDGVKEEKTKTLDFGTFTIEVPPTWRKISRAGIDSSAGQIALDSVDTLNFELGQFVNDLRGKKNYLIEKNSVYLTQDTNDTVFVKDAKGRVIDSLINETTVLNRIGHVDSVDLNKLLKDSVSHIIVDNRKAKLVQPKKSREGTTGIYIDSLWRVGSALYKFEISGKNLKPNNEKFFLKAIVTIKFKRAQD